jgi:voltage-gated potassium channel
VLHDPLMRFADRRIQRAFETGRILPFLLVTITAIVVLSGVAMWLVDRDDFPSVGLALWWAAQTVTTVGYGDAVPTTTSGRLLATGLMIFGFASLSLLTGIIASLLVNRRTQAGLHSTLDGLQAQLDEIERLLRRSGAN